MLGWRSTAGGATGGTLRIITPTLSGSATLRSAGTLTWDGGRASQNWDAYDGYAANQSNWNINNIPSSSFVDSLTFAGSTQTTTSNNVSGLTVGSIAFDSGAAAFTNSGNSLTLNGSITNNSSSLQTINHPIVLSSGTHDIDAAGGQITIGGSMSGAGAINKLGSGTVALTNLQSFTGPTMVSAGALALSGTGSLASSLITVAAGATLDVNGRTGGMTLTSGQTLAGPGNVSGLVVVGTNATVSPGNSPGTLNAGSMEFAAGGNYNWQVYDLNGPAGTGWDFISGTGSLNITAGTGDGQKFNINLWSLSGISPDVSGTVAGFNKSYDYRWKLAEFAGGITGFNADEFLVRVAANNGTGGFANDITIDGVPGSFSVAQGNPATFGTVDQLYIVYVAAPEPSTLALAGLGLAAAGWATRRREIRRPSITRR